ncbi:MAG: antibiotic biosynthesis monooxygenase family protein, partial [Candidatus Limnocylindria bacterium]
MARFGLHGSIVAQPGQRDALVEHMLEASRLMDDAPGCELYLVSVAKADDDAVWITEVWQSEADHDASLSLPGVPELIGLARPLIAGMGDSQRL